MGTVKKKHDQSENNNNSSIISSSVFVKCDETCKGASFPEEVYSSTVPLSHRRRYAQFFTPPRVAKLMAEWAITSQTKTVLDPAVGTGTLIRSALARNQNILITAFEKDPVILRSFLELHPPLSHIEPIFSDFLTYDLKCEYDSVLMNPPYLRHHNLRYNFDIFDWFGKIHNLKLSRLSNSYLLFTLKAATSLRPGGRASIIIPTEWMNANFGAPMKDFLVGRGYLREIVYFSNCSTIFEDALTTASILFLERPA
ncbi:Eco57I restriction-modification methylase domain-containing protein [Bombella intestini]|uniref:Eco57I restriction-modification methylase domain-containing protein n=1 Tax=Bombella intestini TaxID=1539051 RepID=UPI001177D62A|nr:N-6 DNA methylase [Bombella intestini]